MRQAKARDLGRGLQTGRHRAQAGSLLHKKTRQYMLRESINIAPTAATGPMRTGWLPWLGMLPARAAQCPGWRQVVVCLHSIRQSGAQLMVQVPSGREGAAGNLADQLLRRTSAGDSVRGGVWGAML